MWRLDLRSRLGFHGVLAAGIALCFCMSAGALLPEWLQHAVSGSAIEAALFRVMALPGVRVLYPRPPAESVGELNKLVEVAPNEAALLGLRAHQEESALDFAGAERDWKAYAAKAEDKGAAKSELAAFYGRRLAVRDQFATLLETGALPPGKGDAQTAPAAQRSWQAFEQALHLAGRQSFEPGVVEPLWQGWMTRYPRQPTVYARAFTWELHHHRMADARAIVERYRAAFPEDAVFPVKAAALLALEGGGADAQARALAVYDKNFSSLWPQDLLNSYFDLLVATHNTRRFVADAQARLNTDPDDLKAAGRLFAYYRHESHPEAARAVLATYSEGKKARDPVGKNWSPEELDTVEQLAASAQAYPEAARYAFALYHLPGKMADGRSAREAGLAAMVGLLLEAPEQPIALGAGNLSMYRDIGTLDQGPGFWNGVLSLWLNGQGLQDGFAQQETKAQPYFHRAEAAALLQLLDAEAPENTQRAAFHEKLIVAYAGNGEDAAVLQAGEAFLQGFPHAPDRVQVALAMADADARRRDTPAEFGVYDRLLKELGEQTGNLPLMTAAMAGAASGQTSVSAENATASGDSAALPAGGGEEVVTSEVYVQTEEPTPTRADASRAFELNTGPPVAEPNPAAAAYAQVLDRYLGRLTAMHQLPQALAVLRKELDRNRNDPRLYERLATFLNENNLSAQEEEVFRAAIARFGERGWYDKLARFYLRQKRDGDYAKLVRQVTDIFSGTELDAYFEEVHGGGPQLAVELNLYAHRRFPHDLVFTQNLLAAYTAKATKDDKAWERLLRETWWQSPELTSQFFAFLSRTGKLKAELAALSPEGAQPVDPAATQERAEAELWASHFETSAPMFDGLAQLYPADVGVGRTAADLNRSLAWLDPAGPAPHIGRAVEIEQRLLSTNPGDLNRLARIGDILADHADGSPASYREAGVFWRRMPAAAPGDPDTYLQAATVFWDYFQFDQALGEIRDARLHFGAPELYGYEAGAILEGKRDLPGAVREYTAAALAGAAATGVPETADRQTAANNGSFSVDPTVSPSVDRLLRLARRAGTAALVDHATAAELNGTGGLPALQLRVAVLYAENRGAEAKPLLLAAVSRAGTVDAAADLAAYAKARGDGAATEAALSREAGLTPDPVERLQLRYALVQAYESRNDQVDAQHLVDATYRDNPRVLGVVRSTVDFDWRNKRSKQAVEVLVEAAHAAQPPLAQQFTAEAAAKSNESGDPARARSLALGLLQTDPYNAQYLSLAAESYARAGDPPGLEAFYRARLETVRTASMSPDERRARTALLRKGLIPALTEAKNYAEAVDQYIALVTAYSDDSGLIGEAALYAAAHHQKDKLLAFYNQTVQSSPRDARYFVALGQTEAVFGDAGAALQAYGHAVALRPERSDLFVAKAGLEERLGRYNEAVADYARLYQLSYKDPQWMVAAAKAQARQGHTAEAVRALETAYLHGAQSTPHDQFLVAAQLETWNMLPEAQQYAEQGAAAAGDDLLAADAPRIGSDDAVVFARIMTRMRRTDEAFKTLRNALNTAASSPSSPDAVGAQVRAQGLASVTDAEWRKSYVQGRRARAAAQCNRALNAMGEAVAQYGTPEERAAFAVELKAQRGVADRGEVVARWIPAAHAAGLGGLEASWRAEVFTSPGKQSEAQWTPLVQLEKARLAFGELGHTLEAFLRVHPRSGLRSQAVAEAIEEYGAAGDAPAQLRMIRSAWASDDNGAAPQGRYMRSLARRDPNALLSLAASKREAVANVATEAALEEGSPELALRAVEARGTGLGALWIGNYTALGGLYAHAQPAAVRAAFDGSLGLEATVADRLGAPSDAAEALTGKPWFYLAGRYGEWLLANPAGTVPAEDVLAADLEAGKSAGAYLALAQTDAEAGLDQEALLQTAHALELAPASATVQDVRASLLWDLNRKQEATDAWTKALEALRSSEERGAVPESFWTGFARIAFRVREHGLFAELKPAMDETLRSYLSHNGTYRSNELLKAAYEAAPNAADRTAWLIDLAGAAKDPASVLSDMDNAAWLPWLEREAVLQREFELVQHGASGETSTEGEPWRLPGLRLRLIQLYLVNHQGAQAIALLRTAPAGARKEGTLQAAEIVGAAQTGALPSLLQQFEGQPETAPADEVMRQAATTLQREGDVGSAQTVLEWTLRRAETLHQATSPEYLAVAEVRLHTGDTGRAVEVLQALIAGSVDVDADRDVAAALLEKNGRVAEAIPFLEPLARAVPWDMSYRVRLAEAQIASGAGAANATQVLAHIAANPAAPYDLRARAARDLGKAGAGSTGLGSAELRLLAAGSPQPAAAAQPFFVEARIDAAATARDPRVEASLLREAVAIAPYAKEAQALRERVFESEQRAGNFAGARAVLSSIFLQENSYQAYLGPESEEVNPGDDAGPPAVATPMPQRLNAESPERRAAFARMIGEVYAGTGDSSQARDYLLYALELAPSGPEADALKQQIAAVDKERRLAAANAARRPQIARQLDQPRIVRARLTKAPDVVPPGTEVDDE